MDRDAQTDDVNLSVFVFAERRDHKVGVERQTHRNSVPDKYLAGAVIAEDIGPGGKRIPGPAIDVTTSHRATAVQMIVFDEWRDVIACYAESRVLIGAMTGLKNPPSAIPSVSDDVNLLCRILLDIADVELSRGSVERTPPRIAKPQRIDFITSGRRAEERIRRGRDVRRGPGRVYVNAQYLPPQITLVLRPVVRVERKGVISGGDI